MVSPAADETPKVKYTSVRFPHDVKKALKLFSAEQEVSQEAAVVGFTRRGLVDSGHLQELHVPSGRAKKKK